MKKIICLTIMIGIILIGCEGRISPDIHPDKKGDEKGWYFGFKFKKDW